MVRQQRGEGGGAVAPECVRLELERGEARVVTQALDEDRRTLCTQVTAREGERAQAGVGSQRGCEHAEPARAQRVAAKGELGEAGVDDERIVQRLVSASVSVRV